jgi:putative MATE family efflux protein
VITVAGILIFNVYGEQLIKLYLHDKNNVGDIDATLHYGLDFLKVMVIGLIPFVISQSYSSTLRETGITVIPMIAGITAVLINLVLNYILIYGKLGAPELGVVGAAVATVIARFIECFIIVLWTHRHSARNIFIQQAYRSFRIPKALVIKVIITGSPLLVNEALWASGMATMSQRYSVRGLEVVAGLNISSTISNVFNIVFIAVGSAISIIVGQLLGANKMEEAKKTAGKLIFFSVSCCVVIGGIMALTSPLFPEIYNTKAVVKDLAQKFILISAIIMPLNAFTHASYFTLRSGGKTIITFLFDSVFVWVVCIPTAFFLTKGTTLPIIPIYIICQSLELIKCTIGFILVKKGVWLNNMVAEQ